MRKLIERLKEWDKQAEDNTGIWNEYKEWLLLNISEVIEYIDEQDKRIAELEESILVIRHHMEYITPEDVSSMEGQAATIIKNRLQKLDRGEG